MNVGDLRKAIADLPDDAPVLLSEPAPRSETPSSFEDEYGPGTVTHGLMPLSGPVNAGTLTLCKTGAVVAVAAPASSP